VTAVVTEISNTRAAFLKIVSNKIQWVHAAGDFTPPTYANALGNYRIVFTVATTTDTVTLTIDDFDLAIANTAACLESVASLASTASLTVSADGTNTVDYDANDLIIIDTTGLSTCSEETPTEYVTISTLSNTRTDYLKVNSDPRRIRWVNTDGTFNPPTVASALGRFNFVFSLGITGESVFLSKGGFEVTVANTAPCSLSSFASIVSGTSGTSLTVSADGVNALNFDPIDLVTISA